jgi:hypothetical protein
MKAQMGVGGRHHDLTTLHPRPRKDPVPIVQEAGWAGLQGWSGWVRKISPPPGCYPWAVQPVLYTRHYVTDVFAYTLLYHTKS